LVFSEVLENVASRLDGCLGMVVMGMDGIPIERFIPAADPSSASSPTPNFDMLATESTTLLRSTRLASEEVSAGPLRELIFMTDQVVVLSVAITPEYVLFGAVRSGTNYGKARFLMKHAALSLEKEFL
jgi:predicted regulator of Ras-like GTPase activity (Roadblock/LC7/MglB family)